jgi:pimeloyl-ACP methyl ester carboxylesterase
VDAVDLQAGLDVGRARMADYAAQVPAADAVVGWSLGGLAAMLAAQERPPGRLVLLEPSPPAEVQGRDESVVPRAGTFDPEEVYGSFPAGLAARPESTWARDERKRGISIPRLACPALVVYGDEFGEERGRAVAARYGAEEASFPGLDHWGLVLDPRVPAAVRDYLSRSTS